MTRRDLLLAFPFTRVAAPAQNRPLLCMFSKHLQHLDYESLARTCKELGFDGIDLTVRPEGHVLPENVSRDLPKAVTAIRNHGLAVPMITTGLTSPADPALVPTLRTAATLHIPYFKPGYWRYSNSGILETLNRIREDVRGLARYAQQFGVQMGFHNHSGPYVGMAVWDIRELIQDLDPQWVGYYFDPCHATAEGARFGWRAALELASTRLKMVAVKDFYFEKRNSQWQLRMCPLGEGMVDWDFFFDRLARMHFTGPISLHLEYDPPDELAAIARDLDFLKKQIHRAYKL